MSNVIWQRITKQRQARLERAAALLNARQAREVHPDGTFEKHGVWYPSDTERQPCCEGLRNPTRKYPYSLIQHCRTAKHIAHLCDVPKALLKETAAAMPSWHTMFQPVHYANGAFRDCRAPEREYRLGREMEQQPANGFSIYPAMQAVLVAPQPKGAAMPTHILKVHVSGTSTQPNGKTVWKRLKPVEVAADLGRDRRFGGIFWLWIPDWHPCHAWEKNAVHPSRRALTLRINAETLDDAIAMCLVAKLPVGTKLAKYGHLVWELTPAIAEFLDKAACWAVDTAEQFQRGQTRWCS